MRRTGRSYFDSSALTCRAISRSSRAAIAALAGPAYAFCMTFALLKAIALFAPYGSRQATRRSGSGSARA
jgi:hypothetical protein